MHRWGPWQFAPSCGSGAARELASKVSDASVSVHISRPAFVHPARWHYPCLSGSSQTASHRGLSKIAGCLLLRAQAHHRLGALERRPSGSSSPLQNITSRPGPLGSLGGSSPIQDLLDQIVACASASATLRLCAVGMLIHLTSAGPTEREASSASLLSSPWVRICQGQSFKRSSKLERAEATEPLKPWPGLHFRTSKAFKGVREQRGAKRTKSPTLLVKLWV